jgi:hypothetical protein
MQNKMRTLLIFVGLLMLKSAYCEKPINYSKNNFVSFYLSFEELNLPFEINSIKDYRPLLFTVFGDSGIVANPNFKKIEKSDYQYLTNNDIKQPHDYLCLYREMRYDGVLLMFTQYERNGDNYFILLNSYDKDGVFIDSLKIAGQAIYDYDLFCEIDTSFNITTQKIKFLPNGDCSFNEPIMIETISKYVFTKNGQFEMVSQKSEQADFDYKNGQWIKKKRK